MPNILIQVSARPSHVFKIKARIIFLRDVAPVHQICSLTVKMIKITNYLSYAMVRGLVWRCQGIDVVIMP